MDKKIIASANYKQRDNREFPFLTRHPDSITTISHSELVLRNVEIKQSTAHEIGFGCNVIMEGVRMPDVADIPRGTVLQLVFDRTRFITAGTWRAVRKADMVYLRQDGTIWANNPR